MIHPRLATGIVSIPLIFLSLLIKIYFSLSDKFYYVCVIFILVVAFITYTHFEKKYDTQDSDYSEEDRD